MISLMIHSRIDNHFMNHIICVFIWWHVMIMWWFDHVTCERNIQHVKWLEKHLYKIFRYFLIKNHSSSNSSINVVHSDDVACHELKWFTLINRILQIRFIAFWFIESLMQQIFNLFINMIIIESTSINKFSEVFHFAENDNRIDLETNAFFENELNLVTANRIFINNIVNHLLV